MPGVLPLLLCVLWVAGDEPVQADVLLRDVTLHDGSGAPGVVGDLALRGDRIVGVGRFPVAGKPRVLDGAGLVAAPGFIDLHTHCDFFLTQPGLAANLCYLHQGVASVVTGNCGTGPADVAGFYREVEKVHPGTNVLHLVPHNDVRRLVLKNADRAPDGAELGRMEALVERGMKDGAWGLSTGLIYNPGSYARTDELIALARVAARHGGFYTSHIRDEGAGVLDALEEAVAVGRSAGLPVHISHLKAAGRKAWDKVADEIGVIEKARRQGLAVTADQYPYTALSTLLSALVVPPQFRAGEPGQFLARLRDPEQGPRLRRAVEERLEGREGARSLRLANFPPHLAWQGRDLDAIADQEGKSPVDIALEVLRLGDAQVIEFAMREEDVRLFMKQPWVATASDGTTQAPGPTPVHPRSYGCFPRKLGRYALADKVVSLEQAVRSASGLPADILRLPQRGYLRPGYFADVVVFDPRTFRDQATFDRPHRYGTGVRYLFITGQLVIQDDRYTGVRAGKVLRHESKVK